MRLIAPVAPPWSAIGTVRTGVRGRSAGGQAAVEVRVWAWSGSLGADDGGLRAVGAGVYGGVVEHLVYVHSDARGRGIGRALLGALIGSTEAAGIWTIQSGVFPENTASGALHA